MNKSPSKNELEKMVLQFKVSDLQVLLSFAGQNKHGRKTDLQKKALQLIQQKMSIPLEMKIRTIYRQLQAENQRQNNEAYSQPTLHRFGNYYGNDYSMSTPSLPYDNPFNSGSRYYPDNHVNGNPYYNDCMQKNSHLFASPSFNMPLSLHQQPSREAKFDYKNFLESGIKIPKKIAPHHRFKKLSFYKYTSDVTHLTAMVPQDKSTDLFEFVYSFSLSPQTHSLFSWSKKSERESRHQLQLRICLLNQETLDNRSELEDSLPLALAVRINEKNCSLPPPIPSTNKQGMLLKRMNAPINITPQCSKKSHVNKLAINWSVECDKLYGFSVHLVEKFTSDELISKLKEEKQRDEQVTRSYICDKLTDDDDIAATSFKVSLICPLGKIPISLPVRATTCHHIQCFDGSLYIKMNEVKSVWQCPVCNQTCYYEDLFIDDYFINILTSSQLCSSVTDIQINADGSWEPVIVKKRRNSNGDDSHSKKIKSEPQVKEELTDTAEEKSDESSTENKEENDHDSLDGTEIPATELVQAESENVEASSSSSSSCILYAPPSQSDSHSFLNGDEMRVLASSCLPLVDEDSNKISNSNVILVDLISDSESEDDMPLNLMKNMNGTESNDVSICDLSAPKAVPPIYCLDDSDDTL